MKPYILAVEDEDALATLLHYNLEKEGYDVGLAGDDTDGEKPIKVRFEWTGTDTATPRWSQAFSYDGGRTWETNWIMDFRRKA